MSLRYAVTVLHDVRTNLLVAVERCWAFAHAGHRNLLDVEIRHTPVAVLAAHNSQLDVVKGYRAGCLLARNYRAVLWDGRWTEPTRLHSS